MYKQVYNVQCKVCAVSLQVVYPYANKKRGCMDYWDYWYSSDILNNHICIKWMNE
jgi:hypothetical protein